MFSNDLGETWTMGGLLIDFQARRKHRPYVKYASDGRDTIHFAFTEGHPMEFNTGIYHAFYRAGQFYDSEGHAIHALTNGPIVPSEATRIFAGNSNNIAWIHEHRPGYQGRPRLVYTVQKNAAGVPKGKAGQDLRYHFARWDGAKWHDAEIAYAGSCLYTGEDDYAGGICLHPADPIRCSSQLMSTRLPANPEGTLKSIAAIRPTGAQPGPGCPSLRIPRWTTFGPSCPIAGRTKLSCSGCAATT